MGNKNYSGVSFGRFHLYEKLGEGGMATVYKAFDTHLESEVAVKVIRNRKLAPEILRKTLKRFEREARALVKLSHPNIVKIIDYGEFEGQPFLVMPYFRGGTLKDLMQGKPIPYQEAARLLSPIAQALSYAHQAKIIHRDVKPANILIDEAGNPMLTDFGIAKILDEEISINLTGTSAVIGTPEYMAPEQVRSDAVDHRADIYALGVVFYEMVTGRKPFQADTPVAVLFKHVSDPLPRPSSFVPNLPEEVEYFLIKALAKRPEDRYQDMAEFKKGLKKLQKPLSRGKFFLRKKIHELYEQQPVSSGAELTYDQLESGVSKKSIPIIHSQNPVSKRFWILVPGVLIVLLVLVFLINQRQVLSIGEMESTLTPTMIKTILPTQEDTPTISPTATATIVITPTPTIGYKLSFVSDRDGNQEIYMMDIDGSNLINLTNNSADDSFPAFSPDGKRIAFVSDRDWNDDIYLMDSDGSKIIRLTDSSVNDQEPAWSPDGKQIVFTSGNDNPKIYKMNVDGSQQVGFSSQGSYGAHSPSWSYDGSKIVFSSGWRSINIISPDGKKLGDGWMSEGQHPSWSPDGSRIAYDGGNSIFLISSDGSDRARVTFLDGDASEPAWSPDGKWIAFTSLKDDNTKDIYITSLDGKNLIRVTNNSANDYSPVWVP